MELTFTQIVKEEICNNQYSVAELKSLLSSFFKNNVSINLSQNKISWEIKSKTPLIVQFICDSLIKLYAIQENISYHQENDLDKKWTYKLEFTGNFDQIEKDLCLFTNPKPLLKTTEQKSAFLIGAFLSGGSINSPSSSSYHFEIRTYNEDLTHNILEILKKQKIEPSLIKRKKLNVIYIKKSESIADLLKYFKATQALFEFEDSRIYRDYNNQIQRLNNLDMSNLKKTVEAGNEQVSWINKIKQKSDVYNQLSEKEKIYCEIRLQNPSASLSEIMNLFLRDYKITITRTGINHYVRKIRTLYQSLQ